ncbi:MAG TPA: DUF4234 domain-containing protein [Verrucomicrobiae bacterium]|jgi:hypothetical protein|nr:DUF4234 domain-containing protein [Verrucomicrobiae bacterium]
MKHRNPAAVFFLPIITLGIYSIVWHVKTKNEMNKLGANIPTAWLLIVPIVNWYWLWKYSEGVEKVTGGQMSGVLAFVLLFLLGFVGMTILQTEFNKVGDTPLPQAAGGQPVAAYPAGQPQPDNSFGGPAVTPSNPVSPNPSFPAPTPQQPTQFAPPTDPTGSQQPQPPQLS